MEQKIICELDITGEALEAFRSIIREELIKNNRSTRYFSRYQVASRLGISLPTLDKLIAKGKINSVKAGKRRLISENELITFDKSIKK